MSIEQLRVALIYPESASDVRTWSGTPFFAKRAFERHVGEVVDLSPYPRRGLRFRAITQAARRIGWNAPFDHFPPYARMLGRYFSRKLREGSYDLVFAPGGCEAIAWLETDTPIVLYSDATWECVVDYYRPYSNLLPGLYRLGEEVERRALERSSVLLYSSEWAARSAVDHYGIDPARVSVPFIGANLIDPPAREAVLSRSTGDTIRLLMVGVNWENKGGPVALQVLEGLLERGYAAELTVAGCSVPDNVRHPRLRVVPFLNKQIPEERTRFEALWTDADFFILPSRFEAAGLVFCEASAYGLPIVAARTGGIPSIVAEGKNGYTVPHDQEPTGYIDHIIRLWTNPDEYARLAESARDEFETRLNWDTWGKAVAAFIRTRIFG